MMPPFEQSANLLFNWFKSNQMKVNEDGCHVLSSIDKTIQVNIGITHVNNGKCEKLLGIKIDCKLSFENHIGKISKKTDAKLDASARVAQIINTKKCLIRNTFLVTYQLLPFYMDIPQ